MDITDDMTATGKEEWARMIAGEVYQDTHPDIDAARLLFGVIVAEPIVFGEQSLRTAAADSQRTAAACR